MTAILCMKCNVLLHLEMIALKDDEANKPQLCPAINHCQSRTALNPLTNKRSVLCSGALLVPFSYWNLAVTYIVTSFLVNSFSGTGHLYYVDSALYLIC